MSFKKYSPFFKSIKVLVLLSFMYFTTKLDAFDVRIPVTMDKFDYKKLPVYCKSSTKHFECKGDNGETYCLPDSLKCRIKCANDAELKCEHSATACRTGQFQCSQSNATARAQIICISDEQLCDGRLHCPLGDDENLETCKQRNCGPSQFQCQSLGHCIAATRRCDGVYDCRRDGLSDVSDEDNCMNKPLTVCGSDQFACKDGRSCVSKTFACDGFNDCNDGSDESTCLLQCRSDEFKCDGRCMKESLRCDGRLDCMDGRDEKDCQFKNCDFHSEFRCRNGNKCVSKVFVCDTTDDCDSGDDEVCPINHNVCSERQYWTCKSGTHCILAANKCDSKPHCPDESDEIDCPTTVPPPAPVVCPPGHHRCNGTRTCVDVVAACSGRARCSQPDTELDLGCRKMLNARSPCATSNGGCEQMCETSLDGTEVVARCVCRPGYQTSPDDPRRCVDVDECQQFGSCAQLCSNTIGSFSCSCLSGYRAHGAACLAHGAAKLLFSTDSTIEYIDLETDTRVPVLTGLHYPKYLSYDNARQQVFYHDRDGSLASVRIDGAEHRVLIRRDLTVDAIAYDWTRQLLFYSAPRLDDVSGHVGVVNVTSGRRAVLRVLDCPRGLALSPGRFALYVTLWCGSQPGLYTMRMDGRDFRPLFNPGGLPGHLAIDPAQSPERLYWTDAHHHGVFSGTVDGRDLRAHVHQMVPFDLTLFQDKLYFTDMHQGKLYVTSKFASNSAIETKLSAHSVLSVTAYHSLLQPPRADAPPADCSACEHICLAPPSNAYAASGGCLCDASSRLDPVSSRCVNSTRPALGDVLAAVPPPTETVKRDELTGSPLDGRVGSIAGIVIGTLCVCLIFGVAVAMYCLRMQDRHALSVNLGSEATHCKLPASSMPKVNSRTPLTECEIDMDNKF